MRKVVWGDGETPAAEGTLETHLQDRRFTPAVLHSWPLMASSGIRGMPATWFLMGQLGGSNEQAGCGIPGLTERPRSPDLTTLLSLFPQDSR